MDRRSSMRSRTSMQLAASNVWLVVYPFQLDFAQAVDYPTCLYFQKDHQVMGQIKNQIEATSKRRKQYFNSLDNMVSFRMFSLDNLTYRWTLYRKHQNNQQQLIQGCSIDLGPYVSMPTSPTRSPLKKSTQSFSTVTAAQHELSVHFLTTGMTLRFFLFFNDDLKNVQESIQQKSPGLKEFQSLNTVQHQDSLEAQNIENIEGTNEVGETIQGEDPLINAPVTNQSGQNSQQETAQIVESEPKATSQPGQVETTPVNTALLANETTVQPAVATQIAPEEVILQSQKDQQEQLQTQIKEDTKSINEPKQLQDLKASITSKSKQKQTKRETPQDNPDETPIQSKENPCSYEQGPPTAQHASAQQQTTQQPMAANLQTFTSNINSVLDTKVDLKKVIILFLVVIAVMFFFVFPAQKQEVNEEDMGGKRRKKQKKRVKKR